MKSLAFNYQSDQWDALDNAALNIPDAQIIMVFSDRLLLETKPIIKQIKDVFKDAQIITTTTAGEIQGKNVTTESAVCVAITFDKTKFSIQSKNIGQFKNSYELARSTAKSLPKEDLKYIMVFSDGGMINGDDLINGLQDVTDESVKVFGGLAGDGDRFAKTLCGVNEDIKEGNLVLLGLYGKHIHAGTGFNGGWDVFGPQRTITRSKDNILYEVDHESALDLYKKYLGKYTEELPASALLFPISIQSEDNDLFIIRTILSIDEENKSMTFAGNLPQGSKVRFMKSNFDRLISAASEAGNQANAILNATTAPALSIIVSCVGRRLVLANRTEEEVDAATENLPSNTTIAGYYSYGEISPQYEKRLSHLHNQTITITTLFES